jgi:hypothetical protein
VFLTTDQVFLNQGVGEPADWLLGKSGLEDGFARVLADPHGTIRVVPTSLDAIARTPASGDGKPPWQSVVGEGVRREGDLDPVGSTANGSSPSPVDDLAVGLCAVLDEYFAQTVLENEGSGDAGGTDA